MPRTPAPVVVTGMPRSGNTWLARLLATGGRTALVGREPMNPHAGQYRLAGTLRTWVELREPTDRQRRALRAAYAGRAPLTFGRYGVRQWAAALPGTRVIVKDPFALLSLPAVTAVTGARPMLVYRHPAAVLASYRRMKWRSDLDELRPIVRAHWNSETAPLAGTLPERGETDDVEEIARFWAALHELALDNAARTPNLLVVAHEDVAAGGLPAVHRLFELVGITPGPRTDAELERESAAAPDVVADRLHNLDRAPAAVAQGWRAAVPAEDLRRVESVAGTVLDGLTRRAARLQ